jgi:hypothetical protein
MLRGEYGRFTGAWHGRHGKSEAIELDASNATLLMFGGDETEHELAEHLDAEELT